MKKILITGVCGQDGAYLAEYALSLGHEVHGIARGVLGESRNVVRGVIYHVGDMRDEITLENIFRKVWPDEVYNLAGQVFVPTSWTQPEETFDVNVCGLTRILTIVERLKKDTKVYQASSSEMYGNIGGQLNECTLMKPVSPYGVSKLAAHRVVEVYRNTGLYVVSGILMNHECITANTPLIVRKNGVIDVVPAIELVSKNQVKEQTLDFGDRGFEIWDGSNWESLLTVTLTRRLTNKRDHGLLSIEARGGLVETTRHHKMIHANGKQIRADQVELEQDLKLGSYPDVSDCGSLLLEEMAEFLGLMVAEGCAWNSGCQFTNTDEKLVNKIEGLWKRLFLGNSRRRKYPSGFANGSASWQLILSGGTAEMHGWIARQIYTRDGLKRVPKIVLNGTKAVRDAFLKGYYAGDGLKGDSGRCSFKTNSGVLAQGLCYLYSLEGRIPSVYSEHREGHVYYHVNETSLGNKGKHLRKGQSEVRKIVELPPNLELAKRVISREWVIDIETSSGVFMAGIGRIVVHNSPRRGEHMVTRKITKHVAKWALGDKDVLELGNLQAARDWGHARDYVRAMYLMMQQETPDDYVIGTGETHTVLNFLQAAVRAAGLGWGEVKHLVKANARAFVRKGELHYLRADASKAKMLLGWTSEVTFDELVKEMVLSDIELEQKRLQLETAPREFRQVE